MTKSKEWKKGFLTYDPEGLKLGIESVKQANMECQYLHLEQINNGSFIVSLIDSEDQAITFTLYSGGPIRCKVEFQNEDMKHESFPFAEEIK